MKQTIEIEVPEGKKAIWKDNKIVFEDITPKMPKTWEEFCDTVPTKPFGDSYIELDSTVKSYTANAHTYREKDDDRNLLPSREAAEAHLALMQLHQLRDYYRQGWKPGKDTPSFGIIRRMNRTYEITEYFRLDSFLSFQTNELAQEFFENFEDLIKQASDLI